MFPVTDPFSRPLPSFPALLERGIVNGGGQAASLRDCPLMGSSRQDKVRSITDLLSCGRAGEPPELAIERARGHEQRPILFAFVSPSQVYSSFLRLQRPCRRGWTMRSPVKRRAKALPSFYFYKVVRVACAPAVANLIRTLSASVRHECGWPACGRGPGRYR